MANRILVVDDQSANCHAIAVFLEGLDIEISYSNNAVDALRHMTELNPSLVILDSEMPQTDGYHVINQMWIDDNLRQIPVLLMTTHLAERKQLLHHQLLEMIDTLPKPINQVILRQKVIQALALRAHQLTIVELLEDGGQAMRKRHEGVIAADSDGLICFANATALALLRTNHQNLVGLYLQSIFEEPNHSVIAQWHKHPVAIVCEQGNVLQVENCFLTAADGNKISVKLAAIPLQDNNEVNLILAFRQVALVEENSDNPTATGIPEFDPLTGTLSAGQFEHFVDSLIQRKSEDKQTSKLAVIQIDLAHFDHINESLGHSIGDQLLKEIVSRIQKVLRPLDRLARIDGDVFAVIVNDLPAASYAAQICRKLIQSIRACFLVSGYELFIGCCLGIATYPECGKEGAALLKNANLAVQRAKMLGHNNYQFFTATMNAEIALRIQEEVKIRDAFSQNSLKTQLLPLHLNSKTTIYAYAIGYHWGEDLSIFKSTELVISHIYRFGLSDVYIPWLLQVVEQYFQSEAKDPLPLIIPLHINDLISSAFISKMSELLEFLGVSCDQLYFAIMEDGLHRLRAEDIVQLKQIQASGYGLGANCQTLGAHLGRILVDIDLDFIKLPQVPAALNHEKNQKTIDFLNYLATCANKFNIKVWVHKPTDSQKSQDATLDHMVEDQLVDLTSNL